MSSLIDLAVGPTRGPRELGAADLRRRCDPATLGFATTDEVAPLEHVMGQERGIAAIDLGLHISAPSIATHSAVVGQVNGLAVIDLLDHVFARPPRITARTGPGLDGVVDIEGEVERPAGGDRAWSEGGGRSSR